MLSKWANFGKTSRQNLYPGHLGSIDNIAFAAGAPQDHLFGRSRRGMDRETTGRDEKGGKEGEGREEGKLGMRRIEEGSWM